MIPPIPVPASVTDNCGQTPEKNGEAGMKEKQKIPIAYEEVLLTEEAAAILEQAKKAADERPVRKIRRMPTGDSAAFRR